MGGLGGATGCTMGTPAVVAGVVTAVVTGVVIDVAAEVVAGGRGAEAAGRSATGPDEGEVSGSAVAPGDGGADFGATHSVAFTTGGSAAAEPGLSASRQSTAATPAPSIANEKTSAPATFALGCRACRAVATLGRGLSTPKVEG